MGKKSFVRSNKKSVKKHRRTAIKGFAGGAAFTLLSYWEKPVVNSIMLPAHAATTNEDDTPIADDTPVSIDNLLVLGPDNQNSCSIYTIAEPFWGGCGSVQYSFNFSNFTDFSETRLTVTGPLAGGSSEIYNTSFPRGAGTDSGSTHTLTANGIPFAIPGTYVFEVTAQSDAVVAAKFSFIRSAYAGKKKSSSRSSKKKVG